MIKDYSSRLISSHYFFYQFKTIVNLLNNKIIIYSFNLEFAKKH